MLAPSAIRPRHKFDREEPAGDTVIHRPVPAGHFLILAIGVVVAPLSAATRRRRQHRGAPQPGTRWPHGPPDAVRAMLVAGSWLGASTPRLLVSRRVPSRLSSPVRLVVAVDIASTSSASIRHATAKFTGGPRSPALACGGIGRPAARGDLRTLTWWLRRNGARRRGTGRSIPRIPGG